jgi:hypothetical protein
LNLVKHLAVLMVFSLAVIGCQGGGDGDASDSCDDAGDRFAECEVFVPASVSFDCSEINDAEDTASSGCEDAAIDFFDCVADSSCGTLEFDATEDICRSEQSTFRSECDEFDFII